MQNPPSPLSCTILHIRVNPHQRTEDAMAQATQPPPEPASNGNANEVSRFAAHFSDTPEPGLRHVKVDVERTFRTSEELSLWLQACVLRLALDAKAETI